MRGLRGAHVGAHRDVHADVAREPREDGADREAAGASAQPRLTPNTTNRMTPTMRDGAVLPIQIGAGAGLDRGGDFLHARIAGRLRQDPAHGKGAVDDCNNSCADGQIEGVIKGHFVSLE